MQQEDNCGAPLCGRSNYDQLLGSKTNTPLTAFVYLSNGSALYSAQEDRQQPSNLCFSHVLFLSVFKIRHNFIFECGCFNIVNGEQEIADR